MLGRKHEELGRDLALRQELSGSDPVTALDDPIGGDLLRLVFIACHPLLSAESRAALTLRLLVGLMPAEPEVHGLVALLLQSVRGDLLIALGRCDEARIELERAASITRNERERELLLRRAAQCAH